jgi:cytidylate kinase
VIKIKKKIIIAIDGFSSCGKSSFAKAIARELNYKYLDSGAMYRAVALFAMRTNEISGNGILLEKLIKNLETIDIDFAKGPDGYITLLNGENVENEIRGVAVSSQVSAISKIKEVRHRLVQIQKKIGQSKRIVMDGRDIGTIVFPDAEIKIYMVADVNVRSKRRYDELSTKGILASLDEIKLNIQQRDFQDMNREISPLTQAKDALVLDNSFMTPDQQMVWFENILVEKGLV